MYTSSPGPAMATASPATTGRPLGRRLRSRGWTIRKRTPSSPSVLTEATTVPITSASCIEAAIPSDTAAEPEVLEDVATHLAVQPGDHHGADQHAGCDPADADGHGRFDVRDRPGEECVTLAAETVGEVHLHQHH